MDSNRFFALSLTVLMVSSVAFADFSIIEHSVEVDNDAGIANFILKFNQTPDFFTIDNFARPLHSFQYYIDLDSSPEYPGLFNSEVVFRGDEIHNVNGLVIRDLFAFGDPEPSSGGFGAIRDIVSYNLEDSLLTFSVDLNMLGASDGQFSYGIACLRYGTQTDWVYNGDIYRVPAPTALFLAFIGLAAVRLKRRS